MAEPQTGPSAGPDDDKLARIAEHLQAEEVHSDDARLSSLESLEMWIMQHPALSQPGIYEMINEYGPAILTVIRRLLGL